MSFAIQINTQIHQRALEVSMRYKKAESELIDVLEQVENHKVYLHLGCSSLFQYGVQELRLSESVVYNLIAVMRKTKEIPALKDQIQKGNITLSNARKITSVLTNENQIEWLQKASDLTQRQLEKEIVKIRPMSAVVERASYVTEKRVKLEFGLSEKDMMQLRRAQDLVSQSQSKHSSLEETIITMSEFYLKHKDPVIKAKRIYVKKGLQSLNQKSTEPVSIQVEKNPPPNTSLMDNGLILESPHKREPIPASILHQVNLRDQRKCMHVGSHGIKCNQTRWTEVHHLTPVAQGGKNCLENLTTLCSAHHKWIHSRK